MSFYISLSGLKNAQTELGVTAHNIANAETTGFKKSRVQFSDIVAGSAYSNPKMIQGIGSSVEAIAQNFSIGPIEQTGSALDMAINGSGFFTTRQPQTGQVYYTRNGSFTTDENGFIRDGDGNRLQGYATNAIGPPTSTALADIQLPAANAAGSNFAGGAGDNDSNGPVSVAGRTSEVVGKVGLASFIAPQGLLQVGSSNWEATGLSGMATYGQPASGEFGNLLSGALERSNVDIGEELVGLIAAQRYFQANAKAIDTATQISQTIITLRP